MGWRGVDSRIAEGECCRVEAVIIYRYRPDARACGLEGTASFGVPGLLERYLSAAEVRCYCERAQRRGHTGNEDDIGGADSDAPGAAQVSS